MEGAAGEARGVAGAVVVFVVLADDDFGDRRHAVGQHVGAGNGMIEDEFAVIVGEFVVLGEDAFERGHADVEEHRAEPERAGGPWRRWR